jgi:hypothetical protein
VVFSFINSIIKVYKMKKLLIASTITVLILTSAVTTPKAQAADIATSLCEYVATDDKKRMRSFLKTNKLKIRRVFNGIQCNGKNLLEFASTSGSVKTGSLMISKLPKKVVLANLAFLQTGYENL